MVNDVKWEIEFHAKVELKFDALPEAVQNELLATEVLLTEFTSKLGRLHVDTPNDSDYCNMKESRFNAADGVW
jgi:hypothetical protein